MSLYSTYNSHLEKYISNTSEAYFETAVKAQAVNDVIQEFIEEYSLAELTLRTTITFDSDGIGSAPADYFRMVKLWDVDSNGVETNGYKYLDPADFDQLSSGSSYYWTEDYVIASAARKFLVRPTDSGTLQCRYIKTAGTVDSTDSTDSGLNSRWDKVIAAGAAVKLFEWASRWDEVAAMQQVYRKVKSKTFLALKNRGGVKQNARHKSVYERNSLFNR